MPILLIDGVTYEVWTPASEDEFEQVVKEHAKDIFGEESIYLDIKHKLRSRAGISSIPDGYVIILRDQPHWHIVEVELSSHPLYEHIVPQVTKFISGIKNPSTQREIVDALYQEIDRDEFRKLRLRKAIGTTETYKFLSDLLSKSPVVTVIIEKHTEQLDEAISALAHPQIKVVEFQTFVREGVGLPVHAHLFEPVYPEKPEKFDELGPTPPPISPPPIPVKETLEHTLINGEIKYKRFRILKNERWFFPERGQEFQIKTDMGIYTTKLSKDNSPRMRHLKPWFRQNADLKPGDRVIFKHWGPKLYQLTRPQGPEIIIKAVAKCNENSPALLRKGATDILVM